MAPSCLLHGWMCARILLAPSLSVRLLLRRATPVGQHLFPPWTSFWTDLDSLPRLPSLPLAHPCPMMPADSNWRPFALSCAAKGPTLTITGPTRLDDGSLTLLLTQPMLVNTRPVPPEFTTRFGGPPGPYECGQPCEPDAFAPNTVFWGFSLQSVNVLSLAFGYNNKDMTAALIERRWGAGRVCACARGSGMHPSLGMGCRREPALLMAGRCWCCYADA